MDHKVFNDPVHNQIKLHPLLVSIIDTPEFQRLRRIKALGACSYVFPGAEHSRFEHSLGVAHLAKELLRSLCENAKEYKRELDISDRDQFCIQIAALCHDLGAGPLSFVFDRYVKDSVLQSDAKQFGDARWRAVEIFQRMFEENGLEEKFVKWMYPGQVGPGPALDTDLTFIKELILGRPLMGEDYRGREQLFFYKIIGRDCIIDIHKWDYLSRNSRGLNVSCGLDPSSFHRFLQCVQVDKDQEVLMIRDKMLHRRACEHKTVIAIEYMLLDLLKKADDVVVYAEQEPITLKQCVETGNIAAFVHLDDTIISTIRRDAMVKMLSNSDKVLAMWACLETRKLYRHGDIWDCPMEGTELVDSTSALEEVAECTANPDDKEWIRNNVIIHVACFDYGLHGQDPLQAAYFYKKGSPVERLLLTEEQFSRLLPKNYREQQVLYYMRDDSRKKVVDLAFATWCIKKKEAKDRNDAEKEPEQTITLPGSCAAKKELKF